MDIGLRQVKEVLSSAGKILLAAHTEPDGDALGSMLGLAHSLTGLGKEIWLYRQGPLPLDYLFLAGAAAVTEQLPNPDWPDLLVLLDCHQTERAGLKLAQWLSPEVKVLVLDHHLGNTSEGYLVHKDSGYSATAELVALMLQQAGWPLELPAATCLYAGLVGDTGNFTQGNTTARVLKLAGWLVEQGVSPEELNLHSKATSFNRLRLHGLGLERVRGFIDNQVFLTRISRKDLAGYNCSLADLEGLVDPLRFIEGGLIVGLLKELSQGEIKVSLRSRRHVDVSALARLFGGGGHKNAAAFKARGSLDSVEAEFLRHARQLLEKIGG